MRNHAQTMVAADFLVAITAGFRVLYVLVVMEIGSRRILHCNVTAHPTAAWSVQQFREAVASDHSSRFLIHDGDSIFSTEVDDELTAFGLKVLRTPVQAPNANAYCERLMGTIRRECLDSVIPLNEKHLRTFLREWVAHYNQGGPHSKLGATHTRSPLETNTETESSTASIASRLSDQNQGCPRQAAP